MLLAPGLVATDDGRFLPGAPRVHLFIGHCIQGRQRRRAGDGVTGVGTAQPALGQVVHQRFAPDHRTQWHAAGDAFAEQDQVGFDAQARKGETLAGAAKP